MKSQLTVTLDVKEATALVETLLKERAGADNCTATIELPPQMTGECFSLDKPIPQSVLAAILSSPLNKIGHIKECRAATGWGLKECKDYIEHIHHKFFNGPKPFYT